MDDRLYKFSRLAEIGNYTKTAKELHISQPALTFAIQNLERELNTDLFIRHGKRLELTAAGKAAYQAALDHQDVTNYLKETIAKLSRTRPTIIIGMVDSVADTLCSTEAFARFEQHADVTVIVNNSRYLREGIERRKIDAALLVHDNLEHPGISSTEFGVEDLSLVFHPSLSADIETSLNELRIKNFISYDKPSTTYRHIHRFFIDKGIDVQAHLYSTSPSVMLGMVMKAKGCAVLPDSIVSTMIQRGKLATTLEAISRPIVTVSVTGKKLPDHLSRFINEARIEFAANC